MSDVQEGRAVCGHKERWVNIKQADKTSWITVSIDGFEVALTPEAAKVLARQLNLLANQMIKRRVS